MDGNGLSDSLRGELRRRLGDGLYKLWIEPLAAEPAPEGIRLLAPNDFVARWVRDRLMDQISGAARDLGLRIDSVGTAASRPAPAASPQIPQSPARPQTRNGGEPAPARLGLPLWGGDGLTAVQTSGSFRLRFEDFVVGPCNELAHAAAMGVCRGSIPAGQVYLSSAPGLGKTHLLQAIGAQIQAECGKDGPRLAYLSSEGFANRLIMAMKAREVERFKAHFRENVDILLLEDIHFFQGKPKLQDELVNLLNAFQSRGRTVVLSSVCAPKELASVDKSLASRFCSGFLAVIGRPDFATRKHILAHKAKSENVRLSGEVSDLLATHISSDIRQLESCLRNLALKARLLSQSITMDMALEVLKHYHTEGREIGLTDIVRHICAAYQLSPETLASKSRKQTHVTARNAAFFLARKHTGMSLADIGARFNRRHSTVLKGISAVERHLNLSTPLGREIKRAIEGLSA